MRRLLVAVAVLVLGASPAWSHDYSAGDLVIDHPWARPSFGASPNGAAYMSVTNTGSAAERLVGISGDVAERIELHATTMDGDVMRMRPVSGGVDIPPGETVRFAPGAMHVMLMGLKMPLKEGEAFPLRLSFAPGGDVEVSVHVETQGGSQPPQREHKH